jgi:uncharacterized protein YdhG (YjbR/CyaY superfamily)
MDKDRPKDVDEYIKRFPKAVQVLLKKVRQTIHKAAPAAQEKISYGIPTFTLHGNLVHFAGYESHIGFYPGSSGIAAFKKELAGYKGGKGSVQSPLDEPLPLDLVSRIVKFRVKESASRKQR